VGAAIAGKLAALGHDVKMGSRKAGNEKAVAWAKSAGAKASEGSFADAAAFGELVVHCTSGAAALDALRAAGTANLAGKVLVDIANPLDFSKGMPPSLSTGSTDSLGEQIQRAFPEAKVVKTLNTVNCNVMVDPGRLSEPGEVFVSGNDAAAKTQVGELLKSFGWKSVTDLGDITSARATEHYLLLWLRLMGTLGTVDFNIKLVK
jgi:predicted dinucleotide-binding enzyme